MKATVSIIKVKYPHRYSIPIKIHNIGASVPKENERENEEEKEEIIETKKSLSEFQSNKKIIEIVDYSPEAFKSIMNYTYSGKIELSAKTALELLCWGDSKLNMPKMTEAAEKYIWNNFSQDSNEENSASMDEVIEWISEDKGISMQNVMNILMLAEKIQNDKLKKCLVDYTVKNFELKKR